MDARIVIILAASAFILLLLSFLFLFVYRYQKKAISFVKEKALMQSEFERVLLQSQFEVQESTYRQIAQELHDNISQLLGTTKVLISVTEISLGYMPNTLQTANETVSKAIQEVRGLSRSLDKAWLEQFDLIENLQSEIDRINTSRTIEAVIESTATINMKPEEQIILFRILQESIQNAIRHAQPSRLTIRITKTRDLVVEVVNDGNPLPPNFYGMGTTNMRHRTHLLGGNIEWKGDLNQTAVVVTLPLKEISDYE